MGPRPPEVHLFRSVSSGTPFDGHETAATRFGPRGAGNRTGIMMEPTESERSALLAVLAAAAREAQELLAAIDDADDDLSPEVLEEADRRLKLYVRTVGRTV